MKKIVQLFALASVMTLLVGCGAYFPVCTDIPLISQRGELQAEGAILPNGYTYDAPCIRASLAYGFANHFAAGLSLDPLRNYTQLTAGTFFTRGDNFVWELYLGYGFGRGEKYVSHDPGCSDYSRYQMFFVQADGGWLDMTKFLHLDLAFSLKAGGAGILTSFGDGTAYSSEAGSYYRQWHEESGFRFMLEPTAEVRFGWENFKFNVKLGFTHVFNNKGNHYVLPYSSPAVGVGMSFRLRPCGQ